MDGGVHSPKSLAEVHVSASPQCSELLDCCIGEFPPTDDLGEGRGVHDENGKAPLAIEFLTPSPL